MAGEEKGTKGRLQPRRRNLLILVGLTLAWLVLDRVVKHALESNHAVGTHGIAQLDGLLRIDLVHNYGAAWGSFSGATVALVAVTSLVLVAAAAFAVFESRNAPALEMAGLALVIAGGVGNLIDRVTYGYVVDMFTPLFVSFPTFNVADVGITCGFALVAVCLAVRFAREAKAEARED